MSSRPRCGSYPLMNLAADFGVDYGDVLTWAGYLRLERVLKHGTPQARFEQTAQAVERIGSCLSADAWRALFDRLIDHANARWGEPEPIFIPTIFADDDHRRPA